MITLNDLRIGNYVTYQNNPYIVIGLLKKKVKLQPLHKGEKVKTSISMLEGIAVTDALVKQSGFKQNELFPHLSAFKHTQHLLNINILGKVYEISFGLIGENMAMVYQRHIWLHQLQNLYYILTAEELQVNLGE